MHIYFGATTSLNINKADLKSTIAHSSSSTTGKVLKCAPCLGNAEEKEFVVVKDNAKDRTYAMLPNEENNKQFYYLRKISLF